MTTQAAVKIDKKTALESIPADAPADANTDAPADAADNTEALKDNMVKRGNSFNVYSYDNVTGKYLTVQHENESVSEANIRVLNGVRDANCNMANASEVWAFTIDYNQFEYVEIEVKGKIINAGLSRDDLAGYARIFNKSESTINEYAKLSRFNLIDTYLRHGRVYANGVRKELVKAKVKPTDATPEAIKTAESFYLSRLERSKGGNAGGGSVKTVKALKVKDVLTQLRLTIMSIESKEDRLSLLSDILTFVTDTSYELRHAPADAAADGPADTPADAAADAPADAPDDDPADAPAG